MASGTSSALLTYARALVPKRGGGGSIPERTGTTGPLPTDPERLRRYRQLCGHPADPAAPLPLLYPHLDAFPLSLRLMARRDFPYPLPGLVHLANEVERLRPIGPYEVLAHRVWFGEPAAHPKGVAFPVFAESTSGAEVVWRSVSTYLRRGRGEEGATAPADPPAVPDPPSHTRDWRAPADIGRAYGAVSGDRNPIHLHPVTARMFGFPGAIAHGMWTKARCLAALDQHAALPDAVRVRVVFRSPVLLPAELRLVAGEVPDGRAFAVHSAGGGTTRTHLTGELTAPGGITGS